MDMGPPVPQPSSNERLDWPSVPPDFWNRFEKLRKEKSPEIKQTDFFAYWSVHNGVSAKTLRRAGDEGVISVDSLKKLAPMLGYGADWQRVLKDLGGHLTLPSPVQVGIDDDVFLFEKPTIERLIQRPRFDEEFFQAMASQPVVVVGGIPGSGKNSMVAACVSDLERQGRVGRVLWHQLSLYEEGTLEAFLAKIELLYSLRANSPAQKCQVLMRHLQRQNEILIISGLHLAADFSFAPLVEAAAKLGFPARLVLITELHDGTLSGVSPVPIVKVEGFTPTEVTAYLAQNGVSDLPEPLLTELVEKTGGLPEAIRLFVEKVQVWKWSPSDLLRGDMISEDRFRGWFEEIVRAMDISQRKLLDLLSIWDGPFSIRTVQEICRRAGLSAGEVLFERLQRRFVIEAHSRQRWRLHSMVSRFVRRTIEQEAKKVGAEILGSIAGEIARRTFAISRDQSFLWQRRACGFFIAAENYSAAVTHLRKVTSIVKRQGYYSLFRELCDSIPFSYQQTDPWLIYDYAHCCVITGHMRQAYSAISWLGQAKANSLPNDLCVAAARLSAEFVMEVGGDLANGLVKLREILDTIDLNTLRPNILAHARTVEIRLLTHLRAFVEAEDLANELVAKSRRDPLGYAIALTSLGVIHEETSRFSSADRLLQEASELFYYRDNRGFAWCIGHRAICQLQKRRWDTAHRLLQQSLVLKNQIGEVSVDYSNFLTKAGSLFHAHTAKAAIEAESMRVAARKAAIERMVKRN